MMSKRELVIRTARVDYSGIGEELVLDVTVKNAKGQRSGIRADMGHGDGEQEGADHLGRIYRTVSFELMRERYQHNQQRFFEVCGAGEIVLFVLLQKYRHG